MDIYKIKRRCFSCFYALLPTEVIFEFTFESWLEKQEVVFLVTPNYQLIILFFILKQLLAKL